ncbi:MAG: hypothetical protein ACO3UN_10385, partial [Candidatus Puniceispirillaceae bacterium]
AAIAQCRLQHFDSFKRFARHPAFSQKIGESCLQIPGFKTSFYKRKNKCSAIGRVQMGERLCQPYQ